MESGLVGLVNTHFVCYIERHQCSRICQRWCENYNRRCNNHAQQHKNPPFLGMGDNLWIGKQIV